MKFLFSLFLFLIFYNTIYAQTFSWSGFPNGGTSYTTGIMTATITSTSPGFQNGTPRFIAGTTNGNAFCSLANSLELEQMFGNITNAQVTLTLDFTAGGTTSGLCGNITFKIKDINSDEPYQTFADWVEVNAIDGNNAAIAVGNVTAAGGTNKTITTNGNTRIVKGHSNSAYGSRSSTACDDVTFTINAPAGGTLKRVILKYHPDYTTCPNCYYNFTGPNRPAYQYISIGPISYTNSSTTPTISASGPTTFCSGGSVTLTSSAATGNTWSNGAITQSITVSTAGNYTVSVNSGGCTGTSAATVVTVNPAPSTPTISTSGPTTFCSGGSVTLTSSAATGNTWSTGATTQSITVSTAGTYIVTAGTAGCTATSAGTTVTINPTPSTPTIAASGPTTFCAGGSVVLTSSASTGNTWSTGETTQSITVSTAGSYTVSVNSGACPVTSTPTIVTVNSTPSAPTISASGPLTFCSGGSVTLTSSAATANTWSTGATTQSITVSASGTYSVTVGTTGCSATSATITVSVNSNPPTPTVTPSDPITFCVGDSVVLTSNATSGNIWSNGATTQSIVVSTAGTYSVTVGASGCSATSNNVIVTTNSIPPTPTITASQTSLCIPQSATLTSSATSGNIWSTGATSNSISVSTSGTYSVSTTDANGCISASASVTINASPQPNAPTITANGPTTFCTGGSVTLTSSQATGNNWSTGAATQTIVVTTSGTYTLTYIDANGCTSAIASQTVSVNSNPAVPTVTASGPTTFCTNGSVTLSSSATSGNTWSTGATTQSITVSTAGTYSVTVGATGCSATSNTITVTVNQNPATPTITASQLTLCSGQTATLTSNALSGNTWSTGETTQVITVSTPGTYSVSTSSNGCNSANATVTITAGIAPSVNLNSVTICQGQTATLTATPSVTGGTYLWSPGGNTNASINVSPTTTTNYSVVYTLNGCSSATSTGTITVSSGNTVTFSANNLTGCAPLTVNLSNITPGSPSNCLWTLGNGVTLNGCDATYTFTTPGCYDVTLSNTVGGCSGTQTIADYICVTASPNASFSMNPSVFSTSPQNINFINNSSNATSYEWNFGDGSTSILANPSHIYTNTETGYTVTLTATNAAGCLDVFSVSLGSTDGLVYYIPNTFTPDGDENNQTFQPVFTSGYDPYNFQMLIFNRWGELIFESFDASQGWDGTYGLKGKPVQDGIYTYKIVFKNPKLDDRITVSGHVTLIR